MIELKEDREQPFSLFFFGGAGRKGALYVVDDSCSLMYSDYMHTDTHEWFKPYLYYRGSREVDDTGH